MELFYYKYKYSIHTELENLSYRIDQGRVTSQKYLVFYYGIYYTEEEQYIYKFWTKEKKTPYCVKKVY